MSKFRYSICFFLAVLPIVVSIVVSIFYRYLSILFQWDTLQGLSSVNADVDMIAIIDAGSSGSRLVLYDYDCSSHKNKSILHQVCIHSVEPGLSSFMSNYSEAWNSLLFLVQKMESCIKGRNSVIQIPLYLYATGGVRMLPEQDRQLLWDHLRSQFLHLPSYFKLIDEQNFVLSGDDEAYFGWLTVNYLEDKKESKSLSPHRTVGSLDLGGESFEIAFETHQSEQPIRRSFASLGARGLSLLIEQYLMQQYGVASLVINPCLPRGYEDRIANVTMQGSGNIRECDLIVQDLISDTICHNDIQSDMCMYLGLDIPQNNQTFYGMSLFFYVVDYLGNVMYQLKGEGHANAENQRYEECVIEKQMAYVHSLHWDEQKEMIGSSHRYTSMQLLPYRVLQGIWIKHLLKPVVGVDGSNCVYFIKTVNNQNVDWSLGAALHLIQSFLCYNKHNYVSLRIEGTMTKYSSGTNKTLLR